MEESEEVDHGIHKCDFIVRNELIFVLNTSNENMKVKMELLHLTEHKNYKEMPYYCMTKIL